MDRKVKGSFFMDYVRMIRSHKDVDWRQYLLPQDLAFLDQKISAAEWYPMDTFERMGIGIFREISNNNLLGVKLWGRMSVDAMSKLYPESISAGDPRESLIRYQVARNGLFNFDPVHFLTSYKTYAKLEIAYHMSPLAEEAATWQTLGYFERLLELSGASNLQHRFSRKLWEGAATTILEFDWSQISAESKIKGLLFQDYLQRIAAAGGTQSCSYLRAEDRELLKTPLVPGEWYPAALFERVALAAFELAANRDFDVVCGWGRRAVDGLAKVYPDVISEDDPAQSLIRFQSMRQANYNYQPVDIAPITEKTAKLRVDYGMSRLAEQVLSYRMLGYLERLLELSGAKNIQIKLVGRAWEGDPSTIFDLSWSMASAERKVKGFLFRDYVKMLKSQPAADWTPYLLPSDMPYLVEPIQEKEWYPFDAFERLGLAIIAEIANHSMEAVRLWGRLSADNLFKAFPTLLCEGDPMETMMRFHVLRKMFFSFDAVNIETFYTQYAKLKIGYEMSETAEEAATYQTVGVMERLIERSGGNEIQYAFLSRAWKGDPVTILELRWT